MQYFIDGYNVTKRDPATCGLSLEDQRRELEGRLRIGAQSLLGTCSYQIVWDGAGGVGVVHRCDVRADYTRMPTADDSIVARVKRAQVRVGVVTSDKGLVDRCRAVALHGIDIVPSDRLFASAVRKSSSKKKATLSRDVGIPSNANEINRELKELWGIE